ncbi:MAG TPA: hypothetical protein ENF21_01510 [Bacteroidetes bacterium]|nr:hypothetical protein [Bacteroidota bacterium]
MRTDDYFRTVRTRNITYSLSEMEAMRLKAVYNSVGEECLMTVDYLRVFFSECVGEGECGLLELRKEGVSQVVASILVFEDVWSRNMYALRHWEVYEDTAQVVELLN